MKNVSDNIEQKVSQARLRYGIVGTDPALTADIERAVRVAPIDLSVLVTGESGTGKEFFPRIIHDFSPRKHSPYIAVNCGAIPEGTIDSELFGHEKGSFTGAISSRKGYFEEAAGGTIFLDEVAELPLTTQARLLRVLETGEFLKVGSSTVQHTDIRVVAATNVDLEKAIAEGKFREDLFYRLSTVQINVPPLRKRGNDVLLLARLFASRFAERYGMPQVTFDDDARRVMTAYRWPGNVRQLKNVVEQIALFEAGKEIGAETFRSYLPPDHEFSFAPATRAHSESGRYEKEREMLLGLLFGLQNEVRELRERIERADAAPGKTLSSGKGSVFRPHGEGISDVDHTFEILADDVPATGRTVTDIVPYTEMPSPLNFDRFQGNNKKEEKTDVPETLRDTERESIRRALARNNGSRKATAKELSISERTLYRKIKEYGLE